MNIRRLRDRLEVLYRKYNNRTFISNDPVEFPHRYKNPEDILLTGFIAALYSYGKVNLFKVVLERIFANLKGEPAYVLRNSTDSDIREFSKGNYYRFYKESDTEVLLRVLRDILRRKRLQEFFENIFADKDIITALIEMRKTFISKISKEAKLSEGIKFMFPDPTSGSASKRQFMFLRWMVRKDEIDFGIIRKLSPSELIIPLDTHTANIGRLLKMTERRSNDLKCAMEITAFLREIEPIDPVKYDFALAHTGISGGCRHIYTEAICKDCILSEFCNNRGL